MYGGDSSSMSHSVQVEGADGIGMHQNLDELLSINNNVGPTGSGGGTPVLPNIQQQPGGFGQAWGGGDGGGGGAMGNTGMHQHGQLQNLQSMIKSAPASLAIQNGINAQLNSMQGQLQAATMAQQQQQMMQESKARKHELIRQMQHRSHVAGDGGGQLQSTQIIYNPVVDNMGSQPLGMVPYQQQHQQGGSVDYGSGSSFLVQQQSELQQRLQKQQQQQQQQQLLMKNMMNSSLPPSPMPAISSREFLGAPYPSFLWQLQKQAYQGQGILQDRQKSQNNKQSSSNILQHRQHQPPLAGCSATVMTSACSGNVNAAAVMRVVPISISPQRVGTTLKTEQTSREMIEEVAKGYGVADAVLIYTKYALQSIINSLNYFSDKSGCINIKSGEKPTVAQSRPGWNSRAYTIRDLSTCIGAWDLKVPAGSKRLREEDESATEIINDGNADTAFRYYYERSCPILLNAKRSLRSHSSLATLPYCVEDFGDAWERKVAGVGSEESMFGKLDRGNKNEDGAQLPVLTGAIVLKYGSDSKFTGGIGEEGVMTKAFIEFFYHDDVADSDKCNGSMDADGGQKGEGNQYLQLKKKILSKRDGMISAEEQLFTSVDITDGDHESSSLIRAALYALSPSLPTVESSTSSSDDGAYIATIWSGNTNRTYQYCLLDNSDNIGNEVGSKRFCVAVQEKNRDECHGGSGPAKGVCRITLTLSSASVLMKKKLMAKQVLEEARWENINESTILSTGSGVHRMIRTSLRVLRPPKLTALSDDNRVGPISMVAQRRKSVSQTIDPTLIVVGVRCQHELLLDPVEAGKIYINGALAFDGSSLTSSFNCMDADALSTHTLFGVDFTFPVGNGKLGIGFSSLPTKMILEREYGALLVDALIDAAQYECNVAGILLGRLITGNTEQAHDFDRDEDCPSSTSKDLCLDSHSFTENTNVLAYDNISQPCMESIILSSSIIDPVGIGAKAIGTKFRLQYGKDTFPCEVDTNDEQRLHQILGPQMVPKAVPHRVRAVLSRGGYLSIDRMASSLWVRAAGERRSLTSTVEGGHADVKNRAIALLRKAGCLDVKLGNIVLVDRKRLEPDAKPSEFKMRCWYDHCSGIYYVSDAIFHIEKDPKGSADESYGRNSAPVAEPSKLQANIVIKECPTPVVSQIDEDTEANPCAPSGKVNRTESDGLTTTTKKNPSVTDGMTDVNAEVEDEEIDNEATESRPHTILVDTQGKVNDGVVPGAKICAERVGVDEMPDPTNTSVDDLVNNDTIAANNEGMIAATCTPVVCTETANNDLPKKYSSGRTKLANEEDKSTISVDDVAYLLAFYIVKHHPDDTMLERYVTCHHS